MVVKLSIVTVSYNNTYWIKELVKSIANAIEVCSNCFSVEIIIIDNCSNHNEFHKLEMIRDKISYQNNIIVRIYRLSKNYGYSGAVNIGVKLAKGDIVAVSNPDVLLEKDFFKKLSSIYKCLDRRIAKKLILVPKILSWDGLHINSTGLVMHIAGYGMLYNLGKERYDRIHNSVKLVLAPHGAFFIAYKSTLTELGPFDPTYFSFLEDLDIGLRAYMKGYYVVYIPTLTVKHFWGPTWARKLSKTKYYYVERNRLITLLKDIPSEILRLVFPSIFFSEVVSLAYAILNGYPSAKAKIYCDFLKNLKHVLRQRRELVGKEQHARSRIYHLLLNFLTTEFIHTEFDPKYVYMLNKLYKLVVRLTGIALKLTDDRA